MPKKPKVMQVAVLKYRRQMFDEIVLLALGSDFKHPLRRQRHPDALFSHSLGVLGDSELSFEFFL